MTKQVKVREDNYFAVQGWMVTELKLKGKPDLPDVIIMTL